MMENLKKWQKNLYVLIGNAGCGKSTWALKQKDKVWISRDKIRFDLIGDNDDYFAYEKQVFNTFVKEIQTELDNNKNVIADATHLTYNSRYKLLKALKLNEVKIIAVNFNVPLNISLERNELREGRKKVPQSVIRKMYYSKTHPSGDNMFDEVIEIDENGRIIEGGKKW